MKFLIASITLIYYLLASFGHDFVTKVYIKIFNQFGRQKMEIGLLVVSLILAFSIAFLAYKRLQNKHHLINKKNALIAVGSLVFCHQVLIVTNVEMIHFFQYMILGFLLCLLLKDLKVVLYLSLLAGIIDEFFQFVLYPQFTKYLDFNDFILDLVGAYVGILLFSLFSTNRFHLKTQVKIEYVYWSLVSFFVIFFILCQMNYIVLYLAVSEINSVFVTTGDSTAFVLSFYRPESFWEVTSYGKEYHVLSIMDGIVLIAFFCALYEHTIESKQVENFLKIEKRFPIFKYLDIVKKQD